MKIHPVALVLPEMDAARFSELKTDIQKYGVRVPVVVWRDQIIDGRHRWKACEELAVRCPIIASDVEEEELPALVWSLNGHRRDLTVSQRGLAGAKLANLQLGSNQYREKEGPRDQAPTSQPITNVARAEAAKLVGVGVTSIDNGLAVLRSGNRDLISRVERGVETLNSAAQKVPRPHSRKHRDVVSLTTAPQRRLPVIPANQIRENAIRQLAQITSVIEAQSSAPLPAYDTIQTWLSEWLLPALPILKQFRKTLEQEIQNEKRRHA